MIEYSTWCQPTQNGKTSHLTISYIVHKPCLTSAAAILNSIKIANLLGKVLQGYTHTCTLAMVVGCKGSPVSECRSFPSDPLSCGELHLRSHSCLQQVKNGHGNRTRRIPGRYMGTSVRRLPHAWSCPGPTGILGNNGFTYLLRSIREVAGSCLKGVVYIEVKVNVSNGSEWPNG